jgi:hypothetical protein
MPLKVQLVTIINKLKVRRSYAVKASVARGVGGGGRTANSE